MEMNQRELAKQIDTRLDQERREQDERMEKYIVLQNQQLQEAMKRISVDTGMMVAKYVANTNETIKHETQKVSQQVAQTVLDLEGIKHRIYTMDMDLRATGEVAASATDYLARATNDYKSPDSVEYEPITPDTGQDRRKDNKNDIYIRSPPLGEARPG